MKAIWQCPVCKQGLDQEKGALQCGNGHHFDQSRSGYVNLLRSQQSKVKNHGDNQLMVKARTRFLNRGYYRLLVEALQEILTEVVPSPRSLVDVGCGECFYTHEIFQMYHGQTDVYGVDISKDAIAAGAKAYPDLKLAVGSSHALPFMAGCFDGAIALFAPIDPLEIKRILRASGVFIHVLPGPTHLYTLKKTVYEKPYLNSVALPLNIFARMREQSISASITMQNQEDVADLFAMTPYYYKTGLDDQHKLTQICTMTAEIDFVIRIYQGETV